MQGLLESEEELDREEVLSLESENRSVSAAMRLQSTEYDKYVTTASTQVTAPTTTTQSIHLFSTASPAEGHGGRWPNKRHPSLQPHHPATSG